jgi:DNA-binding NarL/FixJ family response regulator
MSPGPDPTVAQRQPSASERLRVGVVAPSDVRRKATIAVLSGEGLDVASAAPSVDALRDELDVVVLAREDLGTNEIRDIALLRDRFPNTRIVVIAPAAGRRAIRDALDAGLDGYVTAADSSSLALAVRCTAAGQLSLPRTFREQVGRPRLSPREKQVLGMVVMGFSNAEIAKKLYVAESTVKSHLSSAFARLGVRSRSDATALILDSESGLGAGILAISDNERMAGGPRRAH